MKKILLMSLLCLAIIACGKKEKTKQEIAETTNVKQEQNVEVYRMITRGTIEEKIQELQVSKRHLVSTILDGTETRSSLSVEEIREILGIQSE